MVTCRRHSIKCKVKTGVKKDGTLVAKQAEIFLNTGAYAETGPTVTGRTLTRILGPYRYPNLKINSYCVYTNTVSAASFRSIGGPQTAWATESQMDIIAHKLGIDPVELRLKNLVKKGEELRPSYRALDTDLGQGLQAGHRQIGLGRSGVERRPWPRLRLRHHRSRRAAGVDFDGACAGGWFGGFHVRHFGTGPGRQDDHEPDRRRGIARAARARDDTTDRHGIHALRPLHRFEPVDDGDGQGRRVGRRRRAPADCRAGYRAFRMPGRGDYFERRRSDRRRQESNLRRADQQALRRSGRRAGRHRLRP